jgi:predicted unusual protein kinase regulating ubiquinone biosynthesis (AarF/ABC1/UbiB family)
MVPECDYLNEARWQAHFRKRLTSEPRLVIPRVYEELCSPRVLVSEHFEGQTFSEFSATATQAERDRAGETIARYAVRTTVVDRSFNTDMHPGNLLFAADKVCVVDFGNVREWTDEGALGWRETLSGAVHGDRARIAKALERLDIVRGGSERSYLKAADLVTKFMMNVVTDDRPRRVEKGTMLDEMGVIFRSGGAGIPGLQIPPMYAYAFRMYWGMFAILADLGAEISFRKISLEALAR